MTCRCHWCRHSGGPAGSWHAWLGTPRRPPPTSSSFWSPCEAKAADGEGLRPRSDEWQCGSTADGDRNRLALKKLEHDRQVPTAICMHVQAGAPANAEEGWNAQTAPSWLRLPLDHSHRVIGPPVSVWSAMQQASGTTLSAATAPARAVRRRASVAVHARAVQVRCGQGLAAGMAAAACMTWRRAAPWRQRPSGSRAGASPRNSFAPWPTSLTYFAWPGPDLHLCAVPSLHRYPQGELCQCRCPAATPPPSPPQRVQRPETVSCAVCRAK